MQTEKQKKHKNIYEKENKNVTSYSSHMCKLWKVRYKEKNMYVEGKIRIHIFFLTFYL